MIILIVFKSFLQQKSLLSFSEVIQNIRSSSHSINDTSLTKLDSEKIPIILRNSLKQNFTDCEKSYDYWYDPYGRCYSKIGEYIVNELTNYSRHKYSWSVAFRIIGHQLDHSDGSRLPYYIQYEVYYKDKIGMKFLIFKQSIQNS
jgi:hypothetical protein